MSTRPGARSRPIRAEADHSQANRPSHSSSGRCGWPAPAPWSTGIAACRAEGELSGPWRLALDRARGRWDGLLLPHPGPAHGGSSRCWPWPRWSPSSGSSVSSPARALRRQHRSRARWPCSSSGSRWPTPSTSRPAATWPSPWPARPASWPWPPPRPSTSPSASTPWPGSPSACGASSACGGRPARAAASGAGARRPPWPPSVAGRPGRPRRPARPPRGRPHRLPGQRGRRGAAPGRRRSGRRRRQRRRTGPGRAARPGPAGSAASSASPPTSTPPCAASLGDKVVMRVRAERPSFWIGETFDTWDGQSWTCHEDQPPTAPDSGSPFVVPPTVDPRRRTIRRRPERPADLLHRPVDAQPDLPRRRAPPRSGSRPATSSSRATAPSSRPSPSGRGTIYTVGPPSPRPPRRSCAGRAAGDDRSPRRRSPAAVHRSCRTPTRGCRPWPRRITANDDDTYAKVLGPHRLDGRAHPLLHRHPAAPAGSRHRRRVPVRQPDRASASRSRPPWP